MSILPSLCLCVHILHLSTSCVAGFIVKVINVEPDLILNIQELGGSDPIRQYWEKYYGGQHVIVS